MSLVNPHPLWTTTNTNPFETNKSIVAVQMLSGRYTTDWLSRKWSKSNPKGLCLLCPALSQCGDLPHLLLLCDTLNCKRTELYTYWEEYSKTNTHLSQLICDMKTKPTHNQVQFLLDASVVPEVIRGVQENLFSLEDILTLTRTFCYSIHRKRLILLGRFNFL